MNSQIILLDIEGTTTPIDFVYDVLFPYARRNFADFLSRQASAEINNDLARLREEHAADLRRGLAPPEYAEPPVGYLHWLMDSDRKSTPLKSLQGKIWEEGYRAGVLKSRVFPDVPPAFERWRRQNRLIFIYSSGSVLAQQLLFKHTEAGDLSGSISGYFDTNIGPKTEVESYRRIAAAVGTGEVLFISDVTRELAAAREAGMEVLLSIRPGNPPQPDRALYPVITAFL